jgi:hypothetical protein
VILLACLLVGAIVLLTGGVVADSDVDQTLSFYGLTVHTSAAQIFLTGAICAWTLMISGWLLRYGVRRARGRSAELARLRAAQGGGMADGGSDE